LLKMLYEVVVRNISSDTESIEKRTCYMNNH